MKLDIYPYTHAGGREENQDYVEHIWDGVNGIFTVADGLGGHKDGALASRLVVESLHSEWSESGIDFNLSDWYALQIEQINKSLIAEQQKLNSNMRSTVVSLGILCDQISWAHVGDSRLYFIKDGAISAITEDHSVSFKKFIGGEFSYDEINNDEDRSRLLKTMGSTNDSTPQIAIYNEPLSSGDAFLLCSDGFWEHVYSTEILLDYALAKTAKEWVDALLLRALPRLSSNSDNLTALAIIVE